MGIKAKYVHTNLIAKDWRKLAGFYIKIFGCTIVPPERDFTGDKIERGTGIKGIHLQGAHLKLPGYKKDGPTLEIFNYTPMVKRVKTEVNRLGYGHIAFLVENVPSARKQILANGGNAVGEIVTVKIASGEKIKWCYVTDPEGNIIELQSH
jgi:predicted enzyme related to lactoylglutathione lyase